MLNALILQVSFALLLPLCDTFPQDIMNADKRKGKQNHIKQYNIIAKIQEGGICPHCGQPALAVSRGIEAGNIFQRGTKYTKSMKLFREISVYLPMFLWLLQQKKSWSFCQQRNNSVKYGLLAEKAEQNTIRSLFCFRGGSGFRFFRFLHLTGLPFVRNYLFYWKRQ